MARKLIKTKIKKIRKRSGEIVLFSPNKIRRAIGAAFKAAGRDDKEKVLFLTEKVIENLEGRFNSSIIPEVEQVQDIVEKTLLDNDYGEVHKAFTLYRQLHQKLRNITSLIDSDELAEKYLEKLDWRVKENANMTYSLQGLNNHVASIISANFWLNKIYSRKMRKAHRNGDIHIHDLSSLSAYCAGWDLKDLLIRGFGGVSGKVNSAPPKHFSSALGQLVNFFYTVQGEVAGAVAFSNFDTYLAPFIRYDKLTYKEVKQAMQEFVFNMNVPTRVGFQCVSEDTEILTIDGWKNYSEVKKGSIIKTFNLENQKIEDQEVTLVFKKQYEGLMFNLKNRIQDQLISPKHRVVRRKFNSDKYVLEPIEKVMELKSSFVIPIAAENNYKKADIEDEKIKLMAWIISEGTIEKPGKHRCCYRVSIYQSKKKHERNYYEIKMLLDYFKFDYSESKHRSLGDDVISFRLNANSSRVIHQWFSTKENVHFIPEFLFKLDLNQSRVFLETYIKADGFENCKISVSRPDLLEDLQRIVVNCGYGFTVLKRKPNAIATKPIYVLRIIKHKETYIQKVRKVDYKGVIWCPHTKNETIIARRNGKVFITGNTPFTNITMDLHPTKMVGEEAVIIGGQVQKEQYKDFQKEMDMINKAFAEVMAAGDSQDRVFTFPIPTYSITKDFDWDNKKLEPVWKMTQKFGIPYFSNFIGSDMSPDDTRSMCPLGGNEKVLIRSKRGRGLEYSAIRNICEGNAKENDYEIFSDGKFIKGKFNKFPNQSMMKAILVNGHEVEMSIKHLNFILRDNKKETVMGKELRKGDYLPYSLEKYEGGGGNYDLGYFVGAFAGDGSFDRKTAVVFSLENERKKEVVLKLEEIGHRYFSAHVTKIQSSKTKLFTLKVHSRAGVGLCQDFVSGKKREKFYRARLFGTSLEFRKGVLDGHYATDGGNRHRIYTSSPKMVESLNMLAATMGTTTSVYKDDREGRLGEEPNWAVLFYQLNRNNYGDFWQKKHGKLWVKIKEVKLLDQKANAYCFEVANGEPVFTVGTTGILTHNCRLRLDNRELRKRGGLFAANPLTGSIGVVTINMPRIGYQAKKESAGPAFAQQRFFTILGHLMDLAKESLMVKRKTVEDFTEKGLYPYCRHYLQDIYKRNGVYWRNHFNTIGLNGMNEAMINLLGKNIAEPEGRKFALEVMDYMREKLLLYQKETDEMFNLEATPAESTTYRFARLDKEQHSDIICANEKAYQERGAAPYYTNSTHLPVDYTSDIFEAFGLQDELQCKYNGGCIEEGNRVLTNKGLLPIEDIVKNFVQSESIKVISYNSQKKRSEWDKILKAVKVDVKPSDKIRIEGERGLNIVTSDWHPFFVLEKVRVSTICPICGKRVKNAKSFAAHLRYSLKCREKYQVLPKYRVEEKRADALEVNNYILQNSDNLYSDKRTKLNNDLMWLIGFFVGDGCISKFIDNRGGNKLKKYKLRFFSEHKKALFKVARILNDHFGCAVNIIQNDKRSKLLREVTTSKEKLLSFLFDYGFKAGKKVYNVKIPQQVKKNFTKNNVFSFLSGLMDSDGHINKKSGDFEYLTVSSNLADDLLEIFSKAGILISKIKKISKRKNEKPIWRLRIPSYEMMRIKDKLTNTFYKERIKEKISARKKRHLPVVRVQRVSKSTIKGNKQFYDLMTEENHNYLAGKNCLVFIHNTVLHGFLGESLPDAESVKNLVRKLAENYKLPYFSITPTFSICPIHGYLKGEWQYCPKCDEEIGYKKTEEE